MRCGHRIGNQKRPEVSPGALQLTKVSSETVGSSLNRVHRVSSKSCRPRQLVNQCHPLSVISPEALWQPLRQYRPSLHRVNVPTRHIIGAMRVPELRLIALLPRWYYLIIGVPELPILDKSVQFASPYRKPLRFQCSRHGGAKGIGEDDPLWGGLPCRRRTSPTAAAITTPPTKSIPAKKAMKIHKGIMSPIHPL